MLWPITLCALDIIVETAMGAESDIQFEENVSHFKNSTLFQFSELLRTSNLRLDGANSNPPKISLVLARLDLGFESNRPPAE